MERNPMPRALFLFRFHLQMPSKKAIYAYYVLLEPPFTLEIFINPLLYHDLVVRHYPDLDINVCVCLFEFTNIQIHPSTTKHGDKSRLWFCCALVFTQKGIFWTGQITDSDFDKHCKFAMTKMIMAIYKGCLQNLQDFGSCQHWGQFSNNESAQTQFRVNSSIIGDVIYGWSQR